MARWALITGEGSAGCSACAAEIVGRLAAGGVRSAGFLQRKGKDGKGRTLFELERLGGGERVALAVHGAAPRGPREERHCDMAFSADGFDAAARWLEEDAPGAGLVVLDGVSKLEAIGRGHFRALGAALRAEGKTVLLCARASHLFQLVHRLGLEEHEMVDALELPADRAAVEAFIGKVSESCSPGASGG